MFANSLQKHCFCKAHPLDRCHYCYYLVVVGSSSSSGSDCYYFCYYYTWVVAVAATINGMGFAETLFLQSICKHDPLSFVSRQCWLLLYE